MSQQLCSVCHSISEDFWSNEYDLFESRHGAKARLQSYNDMQTQKKNGCHLCTLFVTSPLLEKPNDANECLFLRRNVGDPHRSFCLATEGYSASFANFYFFRVPDAWCEGQFAKLNNDVDNVRLMKTWLQTRRSAPEATSKQSQHFLPTRLLDVGTSTSSDNIRLVVARDIQAASPQPYLALSHCWGASRPIRLEESFLDSWKKEGIPLYSLPTTFFDAVRITRQLGMRYLWIDSMCIIQDSHSDWKSEAALMADVYGNACCTLAALSSKNSSEGCRTVSNIQISLDSPYVEVKAELYRSSRVRIFQKMPRAWTEEFEGRPSQSNAETESPLRTRAWVLQEKELSSCTIYFAKNQLLWEEKGRKATAQLPWAEIKLEAPSATSRMIRETALRQIVGVQQHPWYQLVEDYASRSLTYPSDKLVAFSGLAKAYSNNSKAQYLAGNWSTSLPAALLWQVSDRSATRPAYLAPSWSWASLMGSVTYDSLRLEPDHDSAQYEHPEDIYPGLKTLNVQNIQIVLEDEQKPYGDIIEGRITLGGARCIKVQHEQRSAQFKDGGQPLQQHKVPIGVFYPDSIAEIADLPEMYCVALQSESLRSLRRHDFRLKQESVMKSMVMGVVLVKHPKDRRYRRVGLARWIDESLFDTVRPTTIELF
ncbi:uncharacterized protein EKO05_0011435 [Ascochyta rabiei]|uniref:uncharacterized protein n=1 Tax=Didymella rabiei TaxID=5454 RepID=UPI0021FEC3B4|nr:uncharacterized protein EKO05_0011435 [Ascochyta rabiei]UPX21242.1 hypothetical protein EKO05_0011435 [Ascochyta rabiei]